MGGQGQRDEVLDAIVLLIVSGTSENNIASICVERFGIKGELAQKKITEAKTQITVAADFNRQDEVGTAYIRLNDLYTRSLNGDDVKTALASQKELNKLLSLYEPEHGSVLALGVGEDGLGELDVVASHLLPLALASAEYPISEHARIAASFIRKMDRKNDQANV